MSDQLPKIKNSLSELFKKFWMPIVTVLAALWLVFSAYQIWSGNAGLVFYITAGALLVGLLIALGWVGFSTKTTTVEFSFPLSSKHAIKSPRYGSRYCWAARIGMVAVVLLGMVGSNAFARYLKEYSAEQATKLTVMIANFDGSEDASALRNKIIEDLKTSFSGDKMVKILPIDEVITGTHGSELARKLGREHSAKVVIWGGIDSTQKTMLNIHFEYLMPEKISTLSDGQSTQSVLLLRELETFTFQQQTGDDTSALTSFLDGYIGYQSGHYNNAIEQFDRSLKNRSDTGDQSIIYFHRGNAYFSINNTQRAIGDYDRALASDPNLAEAYTNRGMVNIELGEYQRGILDYDHAVEIDPHNTFQLFKRGNAYSDLGEYRRAIEDYDRAINIDPQYTVAYLNRGAAYDNLEEYQKAIEDYGRAIEVMPQNAYAYTLRGDAYAGLGEFERAIWEYDQAIAIDPDYVDAFISRGIVNAETGEDLLALQDFFRAAEIDPQNISVYYYRGMMLFELGDYKLAAEDFTRVIALDPTIAEPYYYRGNAYEKLNQMENAIRDWDKYRELTGSSAPK